MRLLTLLVACSALAPVSLEAQAACTAVGKAQWTVTPDSANTDGMVIVEIPQADAKHVPDGALRAELEVARTGVESDLKLKMIPSSSGNKIGSAFMTFEGALYFDAPHYPRCELRGVGMQASTCWEIHPVTKVSFAKRP